MKAIIENYSNNLTTEPMYFTECLNSADVETLLWDRSKFSFFDACDIMSPDIIILSWNGLCLEVFKFLKNKNNISLIINMSGCNKEDVVSLSEAVKINNINCPFIFSDFSMVSSKIKHINIMKAADIFLRNQNVVNMDYKIEKGILVFDDPLPVNHEGSYHIITNSSDAKADINIPAQAAFCLYPNYDEIIIQQNTPRLSQAFFDAHFYGNKVSVQSVGDNSQSILSSLQKQFGDNIKSSISSAHTCNRRVARFLDKLGCTDQGTTVRNMSNA